MRVLVIDDDFDTRRLLQKILHPYAYVDVAMDGEEGVEAFRASLQDKEPYDLITMDLLMPNSDGQQALREIREIEKERGASPERAVKIIVISGLDDSKELHDAFFIGEATTYIVKPIRRQVLLDEIQRLGLSVRARS